MKISWLFLLLLLMSATCRTSDIPSPDLSDQLAGEWLLYERGYSPGGGYITEEVPTSPPQTITLSASGAFAATIEGLEDFRTYQVEIIKSDTVISLFKETPQDIQHSYSLSFEAGNLMLYYRFCVEGCHLALRRVQEAE